MWILIDDKRDGDFDVICRDGESGINVITALTFNGIHIEHLSIDHDLGSGIDGYRVMVDLSKEELLPNKVVIVSSNPVGMKNIGALLRSDGYLSPDGRTWKK